MTRKLYSLASRLMRKNDFHTTELLYRYIWKKQVYRKIESCEKLKDPCIAIPALHAQSPDFFFFCGTTLFFFYSRALLSFTFIVQPAWIHLSLAGESSIFIIYASSCTFAIVTHLSSVAWSGIKCPRLVTMQGIKLNFKGRLRVSAKEPFSPFGIRSA